MNTNYKSIVLATSLFFVLSTSISAAPGDLDPTFGNGGKRTDWTGHASGVAIQPDGKIVVVGNACCSPPVDFRVARYNPDGSPDTTFGGGTGRVTTDFNGYHDASENVVLQPDGKIIVAGWAVSQSSGSFAVVSLAVVRYNPDGSLDTTFGGGSGKVLTPLDYFGAGTTDVAIQPDGKILVVLFQFDLNGNDYGLLVRYNADGSPDTSFGIGDSVFGTGSVYSQLPISSVTVQPADGKIVVNEGYLRNSPGIARFNTNGSLDTGFGSGGRVALPNFELSSLAIDSTGKIVTAGVSVTGSTFEFALLRFNVDGSPDSSFDGDGVVTTPSLERANSIVIQSDGKIVAAGYGPGPGNYDLALARYNSNGSLDNTFGGGDGITTVDFNNSIDFGAAVAFDSQGRAVVVGGTGQVGGSSYMFAIARFLGDPTPTCPNPIDCAEFFISQQYRDFLGREPDSNGFANWMATLTGCPNGGYGEFDNPFCDRIHVSAGFVQSNEFQGRGYWILRFGYVGLNRSIGVVRSSATHAEFNPALAQVGGSNSPAQEEAAKVTYANAFVQRQDFQSLFPTSMTAAQYLHALEANAQVTLPNKQALIDALNAGTMTRADVLRNVVESQVVFDKYIIPAFVTMEYFGYLRRDPDLIGYQNWVNTLTSNPNDYRHMIFGFIYSTEYRSRFGPP